MDWYWYLLWFVPTITVFIEFSIEQYRHQSLDFRYLWIIVLVMLVLGPIQWVIRIARWVIEMQEKDEVQGKF